MASSMIVHTCQSLFISHYLYGSYMIFQLCILLIGLTMKRKMVITKWSCIWITDWMWRCLVCTANCSNLKSKIRSLNCPYWLKQNIYNIEWS